MRFATLDDKEAVEAIVLHPEVWSMCAPDNAKPFDARRWLTAPHRAIMVSHGCLLGICHGAGRYDVHTNILPEGRGISALREVRRAMAKMFLETDAVTLLTKVPEPNLGARWLAKQAGFRELFIRAGTWLKGGERFPQRYYEIGIDDWILTGSERAFGERFHALAAAKGVEVDHEPDPVHDSYVGALAGMILAGLPKKGVAAYNRWAIFAGYEPLRLLSESPVRLDVKTAILRVEGADFVVEA